jgi:hypothetical protein
MTGFAASSMFGGLPPVPPPGSPGSPGDAALGAPAAPRPAFAHASEAELARILDFYQVRWTYEPDTFPIGWSMAGEVVESFSPDFYLPDLDLYLELTTLKQKLVRKKNRKLRRLRELYPDIRIKLFYARDFRMLLLKFGRLALLDDLSGTTGQATPPRPADRIVADASEAARLGLSGTRALTGGPGAAFAERVHAADSGADAGPIGPIDHSIGGAGDVAQEDAAIGIGEPIAPRSPSTARGRRRGRRHRGRGGSYAGAAVLAGLAADDDADGTEPE